MRKTPLLMFAAIAVAAALLGKGLFEKETRVVIPGPPKLCLPGPVFILEPASSHLELRIEVLSDVVGQRFENCTLMVNGKTGIRISGCELVDSRIEVIGSRDIEISGNRIRDYYVHEEAAIKVYEVDGLLVDHNEVVNNSIGLSIGGGSGIEIRNNIFEANDQHNAISGLNCHGAEIHHNIFRFNFPHALLIMNREADPEVQVTVHDNLFDRNVEDAVNFEDFTGSQHVSMVYGNRINGTGWAGINIEYNSWGANIVIGGNYIDGNGLLNQGVLDEEGRPTKIYPAHSHQPEPYFPGWGHGVKLEDCSGVTVKGNTIVGNAGNGIDVMNARDIALEGNTVSGNLIGISIAGYHEGSLTREFSPLLPEDAGHSQVTWKDDSIYDNLEEDMLVEEGSTLEAAG